jgi:hypothetical protein
MEELDERGYAVEADQSSLDTFQEEDEDEDFEE